MLTPRKVTLMNSTTQSIIQELSFPTSVLALQINRKRYGVSDQPVVHSRNCLCSDRHKTPRLCCEQLRTLVEKQ